MNVQELLETKNIPFKMKGNDYVVKCLNPEHEDRHPSMRIDKITGIFNCFSCHFKGNIFVLFGHKPNKLQMSREKIKKLIKRKRSESIGLPYPASAVPYRGNWRNIKPETYKKFEAFQDHSSEYIGRIMFPIRNITGRIVAFNGRHTTGGVPKYLISPPGAKLPLFPVVEPIKSSIVLVEGIFDVLNLHDKGLINAMCCFGVSNINEDKLSILKMQGIDSINIFFDGDEAGQKGAEKVKELCEELNFITKNIYLKDMDPGDLSDEQVYKLIRKLYP